MKQLLLVGRLVFGAWMLANGANHYFIPLWTMPTGHERLAIQLMAALVHSGLFGVAMAIELVTGALILTGFFTPLALILCMPISFCVFYWDTPLEGWGSRAAIFGSAVLICNVILCLSYLSTYRSMFAPRSVPRTLRPPDVPGTAHPAGVRT